MIFFQYIILLIDLFVYIGGGLSTGSSSSTAVGQLNILAPSKEATELFVGGLQRETTERSIMGILQGKGYSLLLYNKAVFVFFSYIAANYFISRLIFIIILYTIQIYIK